MTEPQPFRFANKTGAATNATVTLGDADISRFVGRVQFDCTAGDVPTVTLTVPLHRGAELDLAGTGAIVKLSDETAALMETLGWTPPSDVPDPTAAEVEAAAREWSDPGEAA